MRAYEIISETRNKMFEYIKSILPKWPDYVLRDWIYNLAKGDHQAGAYFNVSDDFKWGFNRETILKVIQDTGLSPDTKWQLVPDMKFTLDMFEPNSKRKLIGRAGGHSDMGMNIHRDKERHTTQAQLARQQGGVRKEPVILVKTGQGYELVEGWHRTIQHFAMYPKGYNGPAWVAVAQSQQGVAEGTADDINKMFGNMFDPNYAALQRVALLAMQGRQDEAMSQLNRVIKDTSPVAQKKIVDAVHNIKPVTINGKVADSSTLDKSEQHQQWIKQTFIPWVESLL